MTCNESDDNTKMESEIANLERELLNLDDKIYYLTRQKKFIRHRISDLEHFMRTGEKVF